MPTLQIETEQLLNMALQMPRPELEQFVRRLLVLKAREEMPCLEPAEAELLQRIQRSILPPIPRRRLNQLIKRRQDCAITSEEMAELIQLTQQSDDYQTERMKYLIQLSALRDVALDDLMQQLSLKPVPHG